MSDGPYYSPAASGGAGYYPAATWTKSGTDSGAMVSATDAGYPLEFWTNTTGATLTKASLVLAVAGELIAHSTNNVTINVHVYAEGVEIGVLGSLTTSTIGEDGMGDWTGIEEFDFDEGAVSTVANGQQLRVSVVKNNAGVVTPPFAIRATWQPPA